MKLKFGLTQEFSNTQLCTFGSFAGLLRSRKSPRTFTISHISRPKWRFYAGREARTDPDKHFSRLPVHFRGQYETSPGAKIGTSQTNLLLCRPIDPLPGAG